MRRASALKRRGCRDVALVEPSPVHVYRPLQNYVGVGLGEISELERFRADLIRGALVPDGRDAATPTAAAAVSVTVRQSSITGSTAYTADPPALNFLIRECQGSAEVGVNHQPKLCKHQPKANRQASAEGTQAYGAGDETRTRNLLFTRSDAVSDMLSHFPRRR